LYRTVLASSSIGAPDKTAAGKTSPSSLPFITRFGIGEKVLIELAPFKMPLKDKLTMTLGQLPLHSPAGCV
jgi:hypothetical protein